MTADVDVDALDVLAALSPGAWRPASPVEVRPWE